MLKHRQEKQTNKQTKMINICIVEKILWRKKDLDVSHLSNFFTASKF